MIEKYILEAFDTKASKILCKYERELYPYLNAIPRRVNEI